MVSLRPLLEVIVHEADARRALDRINQFALESTKSRNAMIALMNDEKGVLELAHGMGEEWGRASKEGNFIIDVGMKGGIVAYVAATGSGVITGDVRQEPRYKNLFGTTLSEIAVPVRDRFGRIRAVLNIESEQADAYDEGTYELCEKIALLTAAVLERSDSETEKEALIEVGKALDTALSEEELLERVLHVAGDLLRFQAFSVFLYDQTSDRFVLRASVGRLKERVGEIGYKRGEGCTGWVCEHGQSIRLETSPQVDPRWAARHVEFPGDEIASFLCVPVPYRGRTIGAMRAVRRTSDNEYLDVRFTESDEVILSAVAEQLGIGLQHIRSLQKQLESEKMAAWGELSAKSSHMIGNRVFALKGDVNELGHLLDAHDLDANALRDIQKSLNTNVTRVEEILQDFRDFLTATKLECAPTDLNALVDETVREVFPRRSPVKLELVMEPALNSVNADAKRLRRAISELIENSFNYMEEGSLRVETAHASAEDVRRARLPNQKRFAKVEIEDSGPGVTEDKKELIFQPFFSGRVKGMGLGLSIVKGIVDAHGGAVFEAGEEGHGAKFVILLPVSDRS